MGLTREDFVPLYNNIQTRLDELERDTKNKNVCEYCKGNRNEKELFSDEDNHWFMFKSQTQNGKWYIVHRRRGFVGANCIQINNCPICGRKLK